MEGVAIGATIGAATEGATAVGPGAGTEEARGAPVRARAPQNQVKWYLFSYFF